jgi:flagellar hook protein FlgE
MGLTRSLSSGASSLRAHQQRFDVISNNIANTNTIGYKSSRASFVDQFNQTITHGRSPDSNEGTGYGGLNPLQYGLGVKMGAITMDMAQGIIETTNRPLDLALQGDGFFVFNSNGRQTFSRAGAVTRDQDGYLVDTATGAYVQGYNTESDGNGRIQKDANGVNQLSSNIENLNIPPDVLSAPKQTQNISVKGNLNSSMPEGEDRKISIKIFDNNGAAHDISLTFTKNANANEYDLTGDIDGVAITLPEATVLFNNDGTLNTPLSFQLTAADLNTALGTQSFDETTPKDITFTFADSNNLFSGLTQYSGPNNATFKQQDGYQAGDLQNLTVDTEGKVWGSFTNGQSEILGQLVLAKFTNPAGLLKQGSNFYSQSPNSGTANLGTAGEVFPSTSVAGGALESSNVELTEQFTEIINTQRAFEAASRIVTVSDQMLSETTLLKR